MSDLDRLKELDKLATPAPWNHEPERYSARNVIGIKPRDDRWVAHCLPEMNGDTNAELIALMRNNIRALLNVALAAEKIYKSGRFDNWENGVSDLAEALAALKGEE